MELLIGTIGASFFVLFVIATAVDAIAQIFPGLSAEQADMQDRVERVQDAIKEYNNSEEPKK